MYCSSILDLFWQMLLEMKLDDKVKLEARQRNVVICGHTIAL